MKREMSKRDRWVDHDEYEEYYDEDSAWGPPPRKYTCHICVVDVPCEDTLRKHKLGKDHMKREKDLEACFLILFKFERNLRFVGEEEEGRPCRPNLGRVQEARGAQWEI